MAERLASAASVAGPGTLVLVGWTLVAAFGFRWEHTGERMRQVVSLDACIARGPATCAARGTRSGGTGAKGSGARRY